MTHHEIRERNRRMFLDYESGLSLTQLARKYNISESSIRTIIPAAARPRTIDTLRILSALVYSRKTQSAIARSFGVTRQRVSQLAEQARNAGFAIKAFPEMARKKSAVDKPASMG